MSDLANDTAGPLAVECYRRVAELQTIYGGLCADEGMPLTEKQAVMLGQVALLVMDGLGAELAELLTCDAELRTGTLRQRIRRLNADDFS